MTVRVQCKYLETRAGCSYAKTEPVTACGIVENSAIDSHKREPADSKLLLKIKSGLKMNLIWIPLSASKKTGVVSSMVSVPSVTVVRTTDQFVPLRLSSSLLPPAKSGIDPTVSQNWVDVTNGIVELDNCIEDSNLPEYDNRFVTTSGAIIAFSGDFRGLGGSLFCSSTDGSAGPLTPTQHDFCRQELEDAAALYGLECVPWE